jgi:hypothetical protein
MLNDRKKMLMIYVIEKKPDIKLCIGSGFISVKDTCIYFAYKTEEQ